MHAKTLQTASLMRTHRNHSDLLLTASVCTLSFHLVGKENWVQISVISKIALYRFLQRRVAHRAPHCKRKVGRRRLVRAQKTVSW